MDMIGKAIDEIRFTIPREVLQLAYGEPPTYYQRGAPISVDEQIRRKTIQARVLVDASIIGGEIIPLPMESIPVQLMEDGALIYTVPPEMVNFRTIMSILSVNLISYGQSAVVGQAGAINPVRSTGTEIIGMAQKVMNSHSSIPMVSVSDCELIGHNVIRIRNGGMAARPQHMRVLVENDERLANISIRNALSFAKLCILATKSYIYTRLQIALDRGYLENGQEIGAVKGYIDSLSDAEENYQTWLKEEWAGVALMADHEFHQTLMKMQIGLNF